MTLELGQALDNSRVPWEEDRKAGQDCPVTLGGHGQQVWTGIGGTLTAL